MSARSRLRGLIDTLERRYKLCALENTSLKLDDDVLLGMASFVLFLQCPKPKPYESNAVHVHSEDAVSLQAIERDTQDVTTTIKELLLALNDELAAVKVAKDLLLARNNRKSNSSHPAVALPVEILAQIFFFACSGETTTGNFRRIRSAIAATCHHWRISSLGTPALWSALSLNIYHDPRGIDLDRSTSVVSPGSDYVVMRPDASLIDLELDRASSHPLYLTISISHFANSLKIPASILSRLRAALSRSQALKVFAVDPLPLSSIFSPTLPFPFLTSFTVDSTSLYDHVKAPVDLSQAPLLQNVEINGLVALSLPSTSLSAVRAFSLGHYEMDNSELLQVAHCRNVKYLFVGGWMRDDGPLPALEFPALERLEHHPQSSSQLICAIVAPHLKYLSLGYFSDLPTRGQFPALRCFEATASTRLVEVLGRLPRLEEVLVNYVPRIHPLKDILGALAQRNGEGEAVLVPDLRKLKCEFTPDVSGPITSLIESRNGEGRERRGWDFTVGLRRGARCGERLFAEFLDGHPVAFRETGDALSFDDFLPSKTLLDW